MRSDCMKRPTAASLKKVTPENLALLGIERLTALLVEVAESRPDLKRRLRIELAAEQGANHLALELDKRLSALETGKAKVSWRQRPAFIREFESLQELIAKRLADLDRAAALERLWRFMALAKLVYGRVKDREAELDRVFNRAAEALGELLRKEAPGALVAPLVDAMVLQPVRWTHWLPAILMDADQRLSSVSLQLLASRADAKPAWILLIRQLADAAKDVDAYISTYTPAALKTPAAAAEVARRLLASGQIEAAGKLLEGAQTVAPKFRAWGAGSKTAEPDFDWESVWIDFLENSGRLDEAQQVRWASFERTLSAERARAYTTRLTGFDDVEVELKAFELAARQPVFEVGLRFLMNWPSLSDAARMVVTRSSELSITSEEIELWASRLRARYPSAAETLLRTAAALAFRRRELALCDRLTQEADAIAA
jgi:hypothetical protein